MLSRLNQVWIKRPSGVCRLNISFPDDLTKFIVFFNHLEKFLQNLKDFVFCSCH